MALTGISDANLAAVQSASVISLTVTDTCAAAVGAELASESRHATATEKLLAEGCDLIFRTPENGPDGVSGR
jgi:hypothetical protein